MSLGTPTGSVAHRLRGDRRVARAADGGDAVEPALGVQPRRAPRRRRGPSRRPRAPRSAARTSSAWSAPPARGDLLARDVGLDERLAQHAGVDEQHLGPALADAVAQVGVLEALGVERADEHDGGRRPRPASRPLHAQPAALRLRVAGQLRRRGLGGDPAGDHDELAFGQRGGHREVLLDDEDRQALVGEGRGTSRSASR